jgi:hypothetical protein
LPRAFQRVRYFGWLSVAGKTNWECILVILDWTPPLTPPTAAASALSRLPQTDETARLALAGTSF